jgi:AcrR family transcriptional regulator
MGEKDLRERIKEVAVEHFNNDGYHGTTIRNTARDVDCSLPMIYCYYNNKKELFDEIIKKSTGLESRFICPLMAMRN